MKNACYCQRVLRIRLSLVLFTWTLIRITTKEKALSIQTNSGKCNVCRHTSNILQLFYFMPFHFCQRSKEQNCLGKRHEVIIEREGHLHVENISPLLRSLYTSTVLFVIDMFSVLYWRKKSHYSLLAESGWISSPGPVTILCTSCCSWRPSSFTHSFHPPAAHLLLLHLTVI